MNNSYPIRNVSRLIILSKHLFSTMLSVSMSATLDCGIEYKSMKI